LITQTRIGIANPQCEVSLKTFEVRDHTLGVARQKYLQIVPQAE